MNVAIMGYGTVGSGVAELLAKHHEHIVKKSTQSELELKYILDIRDFDECPGNAVFIKSFDIILGDPAVQIVVETMGGLHPAYEYVLACLNAGKSVVTSNKELVAEKGYELLTAAEERNVNFLFEASVGGGIPIIRPISQCLAANEIIEIAGILNGTTNFILTRMIHDSMSFEAALKIAQDNGYAEKDPTADVEGHDACRKICILASLCFGKHVYPKAVYTEGITKITLDDVECAHAWGGVIKLIGRAKKLPDGRISAMVSPSLIRSSSQLASVDDVFNAIMVRGDATGDVVFYGRGAGKMPTASAVVADVIDCAKHHERKKLFGWADSDSSYVVDRLDTRTCLYVRCKLKSPDALARADAAFGEIVRIPYFDVDGNIAAFTTAEATERELFAALASLDCIEPLSVIRVTDY